MPTTTIEYYQDEHADLTRVSTPSLVLTSGELSAVTRPAGETVSVTSAYNIYMTLIMYLFKGYLSPSSQPALLNTKIRVVRGGEVTRGWRGSGLREGLNRELGLIRYAQRGKSAAGILVEGQIAED